MGNLENSDFIINRYRAETIALASRLSPWSGVGLAIAVELMLAYTIRDNLTLNVIMLVHPTQVIKAWQAVPLLR